MLLQLKILLLQFSVLTFGNIDSSLSRGRISAASIADSTTILFGIVASGRTGLRIFTSLSRLTAVIGTTVRIAHIHTIIENMVHLVHNTPLDDAAHAGPSRGLLGRRTYWFLT